jgi:hypothetical protein
MEHVHTTEFHFVVTSNKARYNGDCDDLTAFVSEWNAVAKSLGLPQLEMVRSPRDLGDPTGQYGGR